MRKILFYILGFASALLIAAGIANAGTVIYPYQGGTGLSTSTSGNVGYNLYLKSVNASGTITAYGFQANGSSTGGGSTTTINQLANGSNTFNFVPSSTGIVTGKP